MVVSQTVLWKERKRFMSDGSIEETIHFNKSCSNQNGYEKLYLHIPYYVSDFQVITLWNLNKNVASQISGEDYMELIDSATAVKLLNRQVTFFNDEVEDCDGYYYKSEGEIRWDREPSEDIALYVIDIFDMFTDEWLVRKGFAKLEKSLDFVSRNIDPGHPKFSPSSEFCNRSCRVKLNGVDITDYFTREGVCEIEHEWQCSSEGAHYRITRKYNPTVSQVYHLYAIDKDQELHHLYTSSYSQNFSNYTAIRTQQSGDLKHRYGINVAKEKLDQEGEEIIPPSEDELLEYLKEGKVAHCIQEMLDRNNVTEEIAEFLDVSLFEMDNKVTMTTARYSKEGVSENSHSDRVLAGNLVPIYPQCIEID